MNKRFFKAYTEFQNSFNMKFQIEKKKKKEKKPSFKSLRNLEGAFLIVTVKHGMQELRYKDFLKNETSAFVPSTNIDQFCANL